MPVKINVDSNIETTDLAASVEKLTKQFGEFIDTQQTALK